MDGAFLSECHTPEQWCQLLRSRNVVMSPRRLRTHARKQGQFYQLGRAMLLHSSHLEAILGAEARIASASNSKDATRRPKGER